MTGWPLLGFLLFVGVLALCVGWLIAAGQGLLDRHLDDSLDPDELREAMKRWPP